ncbi:MAG: class I SAM-dependent methyltransferase [Acidimicrobiales bacterium]|nr:class I SAM-dependent methyltransferase [Acidimicrobiales bacterium]
MHTFQIDGVTFDAVATSRLPSAPDHFSVRKPPWMIERYRELDEEFHDGNLVELGIDQGASTAMLALLFRPRRMLALDIAPGPIEALAELVDRRQLTDRVGLHWGVDQSDTTSVQALVDRAFGDAALDLVVDDASHQLAPTSASFDLLFPRLRPGGLFVIEDWSHDHQRERRYEEAIEEGGERGRRLSERIADSLADGDAAPPPTLSRLVLQLVIAAAHAPEIVADLRICAGWCEVRRGTAQLAAPFHVADHLGAIGRSLVTDTS